MMSQSDLTNSKAERLRGLATPTDRASERCHHRSSHDSPPAPHKISICIVVALSKFPFRLSCAFGRSSLAAAISHSCHCELRSRCCCCCCWVCIAWGAWEREGCWSWRWQQCHGYGGHASPVSCNARRIRKRKTSEAGGWVCVCGGEELSRISSNLWVNVFVKVNRVIQLTPQMCLEYLSSLEPNLAAKGFVMST